MPNAKSVETVKSTTIYVTRVEGEYKYLVYYRTSTGKNISKTVPSVQDIILPNMLGRIARIQVLWIDRNNPNKFFIALRLEVNGEKIEIRGYRKNTQYNELCQNMLTMQPCEIPVKLYKEKYFFD